MTCRLRMPQAGYADPGCELFRGGSEDSLEAANHGRMEPRRLAQGQAHELRLVLDREFVIGRAGYGEDARPLTAEHKRMVIIAALP
jgi:hypothetical protein